MSTLKVNNIQSVTDGSVTFPQGSISSQPVILPSGTASNPSISFTGDTDTGLYRIDANKISIASNGARVGEIGVGYGGFTGNIIQVQQTIKTDVFTAATTTFTDITGLNVSITPKYMTSKILVLVSVQSGGSSVNEHEFYTKFALLRDSTQLGFSTGATGSQNNSSFSTSFNSTTGSGQFILMSGIFNFLDSPNSINTLTYKLQARGVTSYTTFTINRSANNGNVDYVPFGSSTITAMELQQ